MKKTILCFVSALLLAACGESIDDKPRCAGGICYQVRDGLAVFEGDIVLGSERELLRTGRSAFAVSANLTGARWPKGRIPYVIRKDLPNPERVLQAIAHYHERTNIRFVPRTTHAAYVVFRPWNNGYCQSWIGRRGVPQAIDLHLWCDTRSVIHEIGHLVGLWHEHTRPGRDKFIRVHRKNVLPGLAYNLDVRTWGGQGIGPYDLLSVMHYRAFELSGNGQPVITRLDGSTEGLSNPHGLSDGDVAALLKMYPKAHP